MPADVGDAIPWLAAKMSKDSGDAKVLMIKLCSVRHQEKLRSLATCFLDSQRPETAAIGLWF